MKHGPNYGRQNNLLTDSMNERTNYIESIFIESIRNPVTGNNTTVQQTNVITSNTNLKRKSHPHNLN